MEAYRDSLEKHLFGWEKGKDVPKPTFHRERVEEAWITWDQHMQAWILHGGSGHTAWGTYITENKLKELIEQGEFEAL